jgi:hypothetical protein
VTSSPLSDVHAHFPHDRRGVAKLRPLAVMGLTEQDLERVRWRNAARVFGRHALFPDG